MYDLSDIDLANLISQAQAIAGEWNGDEPGQKELDAMRALEIIDKVNELKLLIVEA